MKRPVFLVAQVGDVYTKCKECCNRNSVYRPCLEFFSKHFLIYNGIEPPSVTKYAQTIVHYESDNNYIIQLLYWLLATAKSRSKPYHYCDLTKKRFAILRVM